MDDLFSAKSDVLNYHRDNPNATYVARKALDRSARFRRPPILPVEIANDRSIEVFFGDFTNDIRDSASFLDCSARAIYCNERLSAHIQTLAIAMQIAHFDIHLDMISEQSEIIGAYTYADINREYSIFTVEAIYYSAYLLVPGVLLNRYAPISSVRDLSEIFIVPEDVIRFRLDAEHLHVAAA